MVKQQRLLPPLWPSFSPSFLQSIWLDFKNCIGLGTDGCSVMLGRRNTCSRKTQIFSCSSVCMPFNTAVYKQGSRVTPTQPWILGFSFSQLVSHSLVFTQHPSLLQVIYSLLNLVEVPLTLVQMSGTRWLSIHDCCLHILQQWDELKLHFQLSKDHQRCYDAEILHQMYSDPMNKVYLLFLMPFLQDLTGSTSCFSRTEANPFKMLEFASFAPSSLEWWGLIKSVHQMKNYLQ